MAVARSETVLGDFENTEVTFFNVTSRFFRRGDAFVVLTDGPDDKLQEYEIAYTFGVYPLQQYLVEFPGGRLQALDIAWDSRSEEEGGHRWFHLHPEEKITAKDVLHWTGPNLNWNYMCADCHSTNLRKNYEAGSDSYNTSWKEIDVSCEACHGPGSMHTSWAQDLAENKSEPESGSDMGLKVRFTERKGISWSIDPSTGLPSRSAPRTTNIEIEVCARCHSRRSQLTDNVAPGDPLLDGYRPSLLRQGLYHADGQIEDEVYVYGSFVQSKMYQSGVTCSDCHDPHRAETLVPGDGVCYQCHTAETYANRNHHFHSPESTGSSCVECHMPATTYMGVDRRHDHSMRIPRPDLSVAIDTPNACTKCHVEKSAQWASEHAAKWYGEDSGKVTYAAVFDAARKGQALAEPHLRALSRDPKLPGIVRATSLQLLGNYNSPANRNAVEQGLQDSNAQIRLAALHALSGLGPRASVRALPLLLDDVRAVRIEAARLLAGQPRDRLPTQLVKAFDQALDEYLEVQGFNAERPESQVNIGLVLARMGDPDEAEVAYRQAIELQPSFIPAYVNLAHLLSTRNREQEAEGFLRAGLEQVADSPDIHHALGLSLVRQKKTGEAQQYLEKAAELDPGNARYGYVYAVALQSTGQRELAIQTLQNLLVVHTDNPDILYALVAFHLEGGNLDDAKKYAAELSSKYPDDPAVIELLRELDAE